MHLAPLFPYTTAAEPDPAQRRPAHPRPAPGKFNSLVPELVLASAAVAAWAVGSLLESLAVADASPSRAFPASLRPVDRDAPLPLSGRDRAGHGEGTQQYQSKVRFRPSSKDTRGQKPSSSEIFVASTA